LAGWVRFVTRAIALPLTKEQEEEEEEALDAGCWMLDAGCWMLVGKNKGLVDC